MTTTRRLLTPPSLALSYATFTDEDLDHFLERLRQWLEEADPGQTITLRAVDWDDEEEEEFERDGDPGQANWIGNERPRG